jgi:pre-mRNA-processing factor 19
MYCELSGDALTGAAAGSVVVTPSGHLCRKNLLLTKLAENGGMDPFVDIDTDGGRPLEEDDLIDLQAPANAAKANQVVPPRPLQSNSFGALSLALASEYDALCLELFDTRAALTDTRQELSQALYQNDAAVRVIARLSAERDAARTQLQEWQAGSPVGSTADSAGSSTDDANKKRKRDTTSDDSANNSAMKNDLPAKDLDLMIATWAPLHNGRKALMKQLGAAAPTAEAVQAFGKAAAKATPWSTAAGIVAVHGESLWVSASPKTKEVTLYKGQTVSATLTAASEPTCVAVSDDWCVCGTTAGDIHVTPTLGSNNNNNNNNTFASVSVESPVVDVSIHYDGQHALATTQAGQVIVVALSAEQPSVLGVFTGTDSAIAYQAGCLHPDGLIYVAGTESGALHLWDLKSKSLAASLDGDDVRVAVQAVQVSPNGYHIAATYADGSVRVWDLRKQKLLSVLTKKGASGTVAFDAAGKYVVYGTSTSITWVPVKEWDTKYTLKTKKSTKSYITWSDTHGLVVASNKGVECYGML